MSTEKIIQDLSFDERSEKQLYLSLARNFDKYMPQTLYLDPYDLANGEQRPYDDHDYLTPRQRPFIGIQGTTPEQWDQFLDIPEIYRYRHARIAKLTEYSAIKAMKSLEQQGQSGGQGAVTALKEIAQLSKQLNSGSSNKQKIILTYVKPKQRTKETTNSLD